jgi:hypothetical protein
MAEQPIIGNDDIELRLGSLHHAPWVGGSIFDKPDLPKPRRVCS